MKKTYWINDRRLTKNDLRKLRESLESLESLTAISDEMLDVIETEWPELAANCCRQQMCPNARPVAD